MLCITCEYIMYFHLIVLPIGNAVHSEMYSYFYDNIIVILLWALMLPF